MKKNFLFSPLSLIVAILAVSLSSCKKEQSDFESEVLSVPTVEKTATCNPYSLRIMQAALDSLLSTRSAELVGSIDLEPTDYYIRVSALDTTAIASLNKIDVEVFDYPLDRVFEDNTNYYLDPQEFSDQNLSWSYLALPPRFALKEIPYDSVLRAEENGSFIKVDFNVRNNRFSGELLDECYVPEHAMTTRSGSSLPVSAEALEAMAYKIAGIPQEEVATRASSSRPAGYVYVKNGSSNLPVKGVKVRVQKFLKWRTTYTNENGYFSISENFTKPNISIIYDNTKDFTVWGNWAFLAPATFTKHSCTNPSSFRLYFDRSTDYAPWSWSVVNNAAYDYYKNCSTGILKGVSTPPSNMKIWCLNVNWQGVGGGAPMMKHLITSRVLSGASAVFSYMASLGWAAVVVSIAVAAAINIMGPDVLMVTYNKTYNNLYATTCHELSHASHFNAIGEWNYGKLIWYEMTHGDSTNLYGTGGTGADGEGYCEVSETYAFSIENYIRKNTLHESSPSSGESSHYFFHKYVSTLSSLLNNGTLTPGQIYSCMSANIRSMNSLMTALCNKYPDKRTAIRNEMTNNGL